METNPNDTAYPCTENGTNTHGSPTEFLYPGLTKREYFALHFAASYAGADCVGNSGIPHEDIATWGTRMADALIVELNKPNNQTLF